MKIAKARLVSPGLNDAYAMFAVAVSVFVFAYSIRFGQKSILLFYAVWLPLLAVDIRLLIGEARKTLWVGYFAAFACLSTFWSPVPSITLRAGVQYFSLVICALVASKIVSMSAFVRGMTIGVAIVLMYSLARGTYSFDPFEGTTTFVGAFESKNQLGLYASLGILFGISSVFLSSPGWRGYGWLSVVVLAAYALELCHSATSVLAIGGALVGMFGIGALFAFPLRDRQVMFGFGLFMLLLVLAFGASGAASEILGLFGKDTTLTGRTYLWQEGFQQSQSAPVLGVGYQAFWVQGFAFAERLWAEFYIPNRSGFHFHNTYVETLVELGYTGVVLLVTLVLGTLIANLVRLLSSDGTRERLILFTTILLLVIRSFFEIDFLNPYTVGGFLLYYTAASVMWPRPAPSLASEMAEPVGAGDRTATA